jgi:hypothetical protein
VTPNEALLIRNLLNGVPEADAARASDLSEADARDVFREAMRRVSEYRLVHCVPFFPCDSLIEARREREKVLDVLSAIQRWDDGERAIALDIFAGRNVLADGLPRADAERVLTKTLTALPNYLFVADNKARQVAEMAAWRKDRNGYIKAHRGQVREAVERFVSFRTPLLYKTIEHQLIVPGG